jgi:hypothetical protein
VGRRPPQTPRFHRQGGRPQPGDQRRYAADLLKDRGLRVIDSLEKPLIAASLALPFLVGLIVKGTLTGARRHVHRALERTGVAWRVVRVAPERQQREAAD